MNVYNVALWRRFAVNELPVLVDDIEASSPLLAALFVMQFYNIRVVQHVAVSCSNGFIWRHGRLSMVEESKVSV
ncbi:hypothetical protein [Tengunoibacter tsumagoiensis]|uniref:Uncharacterized protein n=1 Tax=Tengunoibacter tsumagoiensis TaxID=2014871 RepID=A0A401ZZ37_9CHLR|nr:hypothetical protein [Tengunoibacter tsumagoiensis]GCE12110.1 hypothetical protein KTT_19690 [Tengunoibacter tsumagoiensis]